ncbi:MAPK/MAK/MRK overlapping kinase-like isoform X2 [Ruditapes philippinarum]|uniref:MAPK/MAK/MRK overlapping kinase-like isoform X2 n=1 Tax=Ruditapes philippinarum TaxID=129788 RepID=UPI00295B9B07|nr:MAPK/MAK/MRK overlapping kinase-like isoform X2 [Ruditapes philippinarum]
MAKSEKGSEKEISEDKENAPTPKEKRRRDILYGKGEYRILGKKGEGTFSEVLKCQNIKDGSYWACKKMKQNYDSLDQVNNLREIQAMRRLANHANILELEEVIFDKKSGTLVLICELMDMNIYELIRGKRHLLPEYMVKKYMYQLCKSVDHMHRNGIFHRDVKPENILIKEDLLKLADFGSCRSIYSKQPYTEYISTRWYRAPECLLTDGYYTYKMDMWSVGCVFFEILSLHPLFPGSNEVDQIAKIHDIMGTPEPNVLNKFKKSRGMNFNFPTKKGSGIERLLPHAGTDSIDLINKLCTYDPDERMTAKQALRHSYFKELRDTDKRQLALKKANILQDKDDSSNIGTKSEPENIPSPKMEKKKDSELHIIASLPKPQSLPAHQLFKDKRKVYQRRRRLGEPHNTTYNSTHSSFFPKVPIHASTINPSYHSSSFPSTFASHSTSNQLSLLPSINSTYKSHKNPTTKTKNMFGHYQLPSLDRRGGAGF